jgi:hypothetical protein
VVVVVVVVVRVHCPLPLLLCWMTGGGDVNIKVNKLKA